MIAQKEIIHPSFIHSEIKLYEKYFEVSRNFEKTNNGSKDRRKEII